jgi:hypothetical protein
VKIIGIFEGLDERDDDSSYFQELTLSGRRRIDNQDERHCRWAYSAGIMQEE